MKETGTIKAITSDIVAALLKKSIANLERLPKGGFPIVIKF